MNILEKTRFDKRCQIVLRAENESLSKIAAIAMVVYVFAYSHEGKTILKLNCKRNKCVGGSLVWIGREIYVKLTKIKPHGTIIKQQYSQD